MPTTMENLKEAFAGESMANKKYTAYARQADKDGFPNVAKLFRAAAEAETLHALGHFQAMGMIKSTKENLEDAIAGEVHEYKTMYPPMLELAEKENHPAKKYFKWALETEAVHAKLYSEALEAIKTGKDINSEVYLCTICGHLEFNSAPAKCPVCGVPSAKYQKIA